MKEIILIKYGDLVLKKNNRNFFIKTLKDNIEKKLNVLKIDYEIKSDQTRMFIYTPFINEAIEQLKSVFGIHEIVIVNEVEKELEKIKECIKKYLENKKGTFKVITKRSDKTFPIKSMEFNNKIASFILKEFKTLKVDIHNPDIKIEIEIRNTSTYLYLQKIEGLKGYPVGTLGKSLLMLSGGIDSPVAGYLAIKKGIRLNYIYFESLPHTSIEARNKVINLARVLESYNNSGKLFVVNFTKIQELIYKNLKEDYLITLMRRAMYKIAVEIAQKNKCLSIINGESIGQVASQTQTSIRVVNEVTNFPIIRPLACFDKNEIINISKRIKTYDISIEPFEDCCTVFVPKHPVINPNIKIAIEEEQKIDLDALIKQSIEEIQIIKLEENKEEFKEYL